MFRGASKPLICFAISLEDMEEEVRWYGFNVASYLVPDVWEWVQ